MVIDSKNGCYRAILDDDHPDGVKVTVWQRSRGAVEDWKPAYATTVDAPFHLVCNMVHGVIDELVPPQAATQGVNRFRVFSVDGRRVR